MDNVFGVTIVAEGNINNYLIINFVPHKHAAVQ